MSRQTTYLPNVEAYDKWSETYDTDGNILQAIDNYALQTSLFPKLLQHLAVEFENTNNQSLASSATSFDANQTVLRITDLGCGTGRAIITLLEGLSAGSLSSTDGSIACQTAATEFLRSRNGNGRIQITGLDASPGMLAVARSRILPQQTLSLGGTNAHGVSVEFREWDANSHKSDLPSPAQAAMSTLVMEHLQLAVFFTQLNKCLVDGGLAVVTNMHPDMGRVPPTSSSTDSTDPGLTTMDTQAQDQSGDDEKSQKQTAAVANATGAGFLDPTTGQKIRAAVDYVHTIEDVVTAAQEAGFEIIQGRRGVDERKVQAWMLEGAKDANGNETAPLLGERGRKWVGINVWFGMLLRKTGPGRA